MQIQTIAFSGRFTPEIQRQLRDKRKSLGLSLLQLAQFLRVSWATIRKWERGASRSCTVRFIPLIDAFLRGEYDSHLRDLAGADPLLQSMTHTSPAVQECLVKIASTHDLCEGKPALQRALLEEIHSHTREAIRQFLQERAISARPSSRQ